MADITEHDYRTTVTERSAVKGHPPLLIWFTGLSGSGKSTLADALEILLVSKGKHTYHLDGDALRLGLNSDLGFSESDRTENLRRVGEVSKLMLDAGILVIAAFVSPMRAQRDAVRTMVGEQRFLEVHVNTPLEICEKRDIKGYYAKARRGEIAEFTGVSAPYEAPHNPDLVIDTNVVSIEAAMQMLILALNNRGVQTI
jgi:adenylyl-sulfate kinase